MPSGHWGPSWVASPLGKLATKAKSQVDSLRQLVYFRVARYGKLAHRRHGMNNACPQAKLI